MCGFVKIKKMADMRQINVCNGAYTNIETCPDFGRVFVMTMRLKPPRFVTYVKLSVILLRKRTKSVRPTGFTHRVKLLENNKVCGVLNTNIGIILQSKKCCVQ